MNTQSGRSRLTATGRGRGARLSGTTQAPRRHHQQAQHDLGHGGAQAMALAQSQQHGCDGEPPNSATGI